MKSLAALIALRCEDIKTLNMLESPDEQLEVKRRAAILLKKAEVRWLIKTHMRYKFEVGFSSSDAQNIVLSTVPSDEVTVLLTVRAILFEPYITCDPTFLGKGDRSTISILDAMADLVRQVPEGVPNNLVEA